MTDPDEAIEEFLRKADAAYTGMTEFSLRVEQDPSAASARCSRPPTPASRAVVQPGGSVNDEDATDRHRRIFGTDDS